MMCGFENNLHNHLIYVRLSTTILKTHHLITINFMSFWKKNLIQDILIVLKALSSMLKNKTG